MYTLPNEASATTEIRLHFQKGLAYVDSALQLAEEILSTGKTPAPVQEKLFIGCQIGLLVSGIRTLHAIRILCEHGMDEDQAMLPLRTLIEIVANSKMLNEGNKIKNAQLYRDFYLIKEYKVLESASRYSATEQLKEDWRKLLAGRNSYINEIKSRLKSKGYKKLRKNNSWFKGGTSISDLVKKARMEAQYDMAYAKGSQVAHGMNIAHWIVSSANPTEILIDHTASYKWVPNVLQEAFNLFSVLLLVADDSLNAGKIEQIKNLWKEAGQYWDEILRREHS